MYFSAQTMRDKGYPMKTEHNLKSLTELELQIQNRISEFNGKRSENQSSNKFFTMSQMCLGAFTTLLIAINAKFTYFPITIAALVASSLATLSGQILSKFMYSERMAVNIATVCALYELAHDITMDRKKEEDDRSKHEITLKKVDNYQGRYQQILNTANGQWQKNIHKTSKNK